MCLRMIIGVGLTETCNVSFFKTLSKADVEEFVFDHLIYLYRRLFSANREVVLLPNLSS